MKNCPRCGQAVPADAQVCSHCYFNFSNTQGGNGNPGNAGSFGPQMGQETKPQMPNNAQPQTNFGPQMNQTQNDFMGPQFNRSSGMGYWTWFKQTLAHPFTLIQTDQHYGLLSFMFAFVGMILAYVGYSQAQTAALVSSLGGAAAGAMVTAGSGGVSIFVGIGLLLIWCLQLIIPPIMRRSFYREEFHVPFLTRYMNYANIMIVFELGAFVFGLLRISFIVSIFVLLAFFTVSAANMFIVLDLQGTDHKPRLDRFYIYLINITLTAIIEIGLILILSAVFGAIIAGSMMNSFGLIALL